MIRKNRVLKIPIKRKKKYSSKFNKSNRYSMKNYET